MTWAAEPWRDDDTPPESGVRVRLPAAFVAPARAAAMEAGPSHAEVLAEITADVVLEVWDHVKVLAPLQGAWLTIDVVRIGAAFLAFTGLRCAAPAQPAARVLRERWPELVPGYRAMDRLASLMVDALCDRWHVRG